MGKNLMHCLLLALSIVTQNIVAAPIKEPIKEPEVPQGSALITGLQDINFPPIQATVHSDQQKTIYVCVHISSSTNNKSISQPTYQVRISSNNGAFVMSSSNYTIPTTILWGNHPGKSISVPYNQAIYRDGSGKVLTGSPSKNCNGDTNAALTINIAAADLNNKTAGNYRQTLYITVAPL